MAGPVESITLVSEEQDHIQSISKVIGKDPEWQGYVLVASVCDLPVAESVEGTALVSWTEDHIHGMRRSLGEILKCQAQCFPRHPAHRFKTRTQRIA